MREVIIHLPIFWDIHSSGCANNLVTHQFFYRRYGSDSVQRQLRTSGDLVQPLSNNDAVCYEYSSSLVKHRSQKRPALSLHQRGVKTSLGMSALKLECSHANCTLAIQRSLASAEKQNVEIARKLHCHWVFTLVYSQCFSSRWSSNDGDFRLRDGGFQRCQNDGVSVRMTEGWHVQYATHTCDSPWYAQCSGLLPLHFIERTSPAFRTSSSLTLSTGRPPDGAALTKVTAAIDLWPATKTKHVPWSSDIKRSICK